MSEEPKLMIEFIQSPQSRHHRQLVHPVFIMQGPANIGYCSFGGSMCHHVYVHLSICFCFCGLCLLLQQLGVSGSTYIVYSTCIMSYMDSLHDVSIMPIMGYGTCYTTDKRFSQEATFLAEAQIIDLSFPLLIPVW